MCCVKKMLLPVYMVISPQSFLFYNHPHYRSILHKTALGYDGNVHKVVLRVNYTETTSMKEQLMAFIAVTIHVNNKEHKMDFHFRMLSGLLNLTSSRNFKT